MDPRDSVSRARTFALSAHGDQRYGSLPYAAHLDAVALILAPYGEDAQIVGYLHDVIEDTAVTREDLVEAFGDFIAECVEIVTDESGPDRAERKRKTYRKMAQVDKEHRLALIVKAADRLANLIACINFNHPILLEVYKKEHEAFTAAVYRKGLCDELWNEINSLVYK